MPMIRRAENTTCEANLKQTCSAFMALIVARNLNDIFIISFNLFAPLVELLNVLKSLVFGPALWFLSVSCVHNTRIKIQMLYRD
jgi:hypothetical protein